MVQAEVLQRVLRIRHGNSAGTAFTIECNKTQFIVTAKHIFEDSAYPVSTNIDLLIDGNYQTFCVDIRYPADQDIDIAVMKTNPLTFVTPVYPNKNSSAGCIFGQDVYFLGFPFNYEELLSHFPNSNAPTPFIKKACFSGAQGTYQFFLDGINNRGFSGGPVCFKSQGDQTFSIAGVISGYRYDKIPVYDKNTDKPLPQYVEENTGIIIVFDICSAVDIAEKWDDNN